MRSDMSGTGPVEVHNGIYWGWVVVIGAFFMLGINYGARYSFGVFVKPMFSEYGWSMSTISLGATVNLLMYAASGVVAGRLLDRMAPRWIMTIGVVLSALGFGLMGIARHPYQIYLFFGVLCGLGSAGFGVVINSSSVGKWFIRKKGVAVGVASMGIGLGTMLMTPYAGWAVKNFGWRTGFLSIGVCMVLFGVVVAQICMGKSNPEAHGLLPDGESIRAGAPLGTEQFKDDTALTMTSILKNSRFWILAVCFSAAAIVPLMMFVHLVAHATNCNIEKIAAASSLGIIGVASIFGRFFHGFVSDRLRDPKYAAVIGFSIMAAAMALMLKVATVGMLYLFAVVFGFGYGCMAPLMPVILSDRFGRQTLGSAYGTLSFFVAGIGSLGPLLGGLIYDTTGSYTSAWRINLVILIIVAVLMMFLKPREPALYEGK